MRRYLALLRNRPFAALWLGSTVSAIGDSLTWVALVWLVIEVGGSPAALGGLVVAGLLVSPMTIWAQTIRMRVTPTELRGRIFGTLRTLMQSRPPLGGALAGALLVGPGVVPTVVAMTVVMAVPGVLGLFTPALADEHTRVSDTVPAG